MKILFKSFAVAALLVFGLFFIQFFIGEGRRCLPLNAFCVN